MAEAGTDESATRNQLKSLFLVLSAGTMWSFGALIVRYMVDAHVYQWQYLLFRGLTITAVLSIFLAAKDGLSFIESFRRVGLSGLLGACGLVVAFSGYIWSITMTTVANTLFMFATMPFIAAFLGIVLLQERLRSLTWVAMAMALTGVLVMVAEGLEAGNLLGNLIALAGAGGFAVFSVSLRWRRDTPQFTTVALAGILCAAFTLVILSVHHDSLLMPVRNVYLSLLHGFLAGTGLILFSWGARYIPAAESTLLSLVEIVGGILWVYLPFLGIHEVPSMLTIVGGSIVLGAIVIDSLWAHYR